MIEASLSFKVAHEIGYGIGVGLIGLALIGMVLMRGLLPKVALGVVLFGLAAYVFVVRSSIAPSGVCNGSFFFAHVQASSSECDKIKKGEPV